MAGIADPIWSRLGRVRERFIKRPRSVPGRFHTRRTRGDTRIGSAVDQGFRRSIHLLDEKCVKTRGSLQAFGRNRFIHVARGVIELPD